MRLQRCLVAVGMGIWEVGEVRLSQRRSKDINVILMRWGEVVGMGIRS